MSDSPIEAIKARLDAVELIGETVPLKKAGRTYKALCPFHAEKTPSFIVWPETGTWKCFGCGEGGDLFHFVMKRDRIDFREALELLAARAGVELPSRPGRSPEQDEEHARLYAVLQTAALYYHAMLLSPAGLAAREYLERRGLSPETIETALLGFAPHAPGAFERHLVEAGFTRQELTAAGLLGSGEHGTFDWFRGRVLFPIRDQQGRVVGFGGRAMSDEVQPKYLNSPQTPLFDKGALLYGLDRARAAIRSEGRAVVVEGYMDVLAVHQAGFLNVVATLGTSITERHLDQLKRLAPEIVLALDPDTAGLHATERAIEVARSAQPDDVVPEIAVEVGRRGLLRTLVRYRGTRKTRVRVALLPAGLDPDDLVRHDPGAWRSLVEQALPVVDFALARLGQRYDLSSAEGKRAAAEDALDLIADMVDAVERAHYLQRLARLLQVSERELAEKARRPVAPARGESGAAAPPTGDTLEEYTLALAAHLGPSALQQLDPGHFETTEGRALLSFLQRSSQGDTLDLAALEPYVEPWLESSLRRMAQYNAMWELVPEEALGERLADLRLRLEERALFREQRQIHELLAADGEADGGRWYTELAALARRIRQVQASRASLNRAGARA